MKVTVVGAGNVGTQIAVHAAEIGNKVTIFTSNPEQIKNNLKIVNENEVVIHEGIIELITANAEDAFNDADLIFITYPSFKFEEFSKKIFPYVKEKQMICLVPGTGGGEWFFKDCIDKGAILIGLQRVPSVARLEKKGETVRAIGYRKELKIATLPSRYSEECKNIIANIFKMNCSIISNYLSITLTPSNPILHTTRLREIFKNYKDGIYYDDLPLFYEDWNDESSKLLLECDKELQKICRKIEHVEDIDLSEVRSLKEHYESENEKELTNKIRSINGFKGLETPYVEKCGKLIPDFNSRYFTADFPYGLEIFTQIGHMANVNIKNMDETLEWYKKFNIEKNHFDFSNFNVTTLDDLLELYKK